MTRKNSKIFYCFIVSLFIQTHLHAQKIHANNNWKLSSTAIAGLNKNKEQVRDFILTGNHLNSLLKILQAKQVPIIYINIPSRSVIVKCKTNYAYQVLLSLKEIIFVDIVQPAHPEIGIIGNDRSFHGINAVDYSIPGANGKNIVVGVKEQKMEEADLDLWKRVLPSSLSAATVSNHATVISSIIGGSGNSFYDGRGIAWGAKFFSSSFANLFPDDPATLNINKVTVQNHSYGSIIQQFYGAEAVSYDAQTFDNKNLVHVFSAGNRGLDAPIDGRYSGITGFANLTGNFKTAKNVITVGAIDNKSMIPAETSSGPVYDGRLAPQLIALGPNGTSDAAAVVSGTIAVMQQVYADSNNQSLPPASLIKAILFNNTEDVNNKGIDHKTGFGQLDAYSSIRSLQQKKYDGGTVSQGQTWTKNIIIPASAAHMKLTLVWTDIQAAVNNTRALVTDLDLEVLEINTGIVYKPWVLSVAANKDSLEKLAVRKRDSLNTAEQVSIALPPAGNYMVKVSGTSITIPNFPFHIAFNIDTLNTFYFISPQHSSDVNRAENPIATIRWKSFVADTNQTGNLFISYNNGGHWELIRSGYKIYKNQDKWPIKDTSSRAMFRMETSFGNFLSKETIISAVTRPKVDFACSDSFRLSWNKHIYANGYRLFTLTDSPYLKHAITVSDTFVIINRATYSSKVWAVEPLLNNGLGSVRSLAFDIDQQGVKCFYKSLYYELLAQNKVNLKLELSAPGYVDSLYFEILSASGQLLRSAGGAKANAGISLYEQLVDSLLKGTNYFRVKIKLKNGQVVYTEVISILISGKQLIVLYPNPVNRNAGLNYIFQQGLPAGTELRIYDISGRLLKVESALAGTINVAKFPAGLYIYKVTTVEKNVLETGKILVL